MDKEAKKFGLIRTKHLEGDHYDRVKEQIDILNTELYGCAQKIWNNLNNPKGIVIYLDEDSASAVSKEVTDFNDPDLQNFCDSKRVNTNDVIYFRIEFSYENGHEYRIDLFYRDLDCGTGNIHVIPGIIRIYKKRNDNLDNNNWSIQKNKKEFICERGWDAAFNENFVDKLFKDVPKFIENKKSFYYLQTNNSNPFNKICEINKSYGEPYGKSEVGRGFLYGQYGHLLWFKKSSVYIIENKNDEDDQKNYFHIDEDQIIREMTLTYCNVFLDEDDKSSLYTFYTKWQQYAAHNGNCQKFEINNPIWNFAYPVKEVTDDTER